MIFVTVGHQMPFDRLIKLVDEWAGEAGRRDIFAQIGDSRYPAKNITCSTFVSPDEFSEHMSSAEAVIAHAGTGTIIEALKRNKPMLVLPRRAALQETRSDHQIPTAQHFETNGYILAAYEDADFVEKAEQLMSFRPSSSLGEACTSPIIDRVRNFILS